MKKQIITAVAGGLVATAVSFGGAAVADAAPGAKGDCVQDGIGFLRTNGLLQAAARQQIDYSTLGPDAAGPIRVQLPEGSFLSLGQVVKLHTTNPELFPWCD